MPKSLLADCRLPWVERSREDYPSGCDRAYEVKGAGATLYLSRHTRGTNGKAWMGYLSIVLVYQVFTCRVTPLASAELVERELIARVRWLKQTVDVLATALGAVGP